MKITVTTEVAPMCPLKAAIANLKVVALQQVAAHMGIECEVEYSKHFTDYSIVACEEVGMELVHWLRRIGCVDVLVETGDKVSASLIEDFYGKLFSVCLTA